mgnify:CR=1 FL=1
MGYIQNYGLWMANHFTNNDISPNFSRREINMRKIKCPICNFEGDEDDFFMQNVLSCPKCGTTIMILACPKCGCNIAIDYYEKEEKKNDSL